MYLNFERRINIGKKRNTYPYEQYHKYINGVLYKLCANPDCKIGWMPCNEEYFYKNKKNLSDGLFPICKECTKKQAMQWQENNYERYRQSNRKTNKRPERQQQMREYAKTQRLKGYQKRWQLNNPDKIKIYNEKRKHKNHNITKEEWESCKKYFDYKCAYCDLPLENHNRIISGKIQKIDFHKEHVHNNGSNDLSNCVPACCSCNDKKWCFEFEEWYNEDNPIYSKERYNKIIQWITKDYKQFIN